MTVISQYRGRFAPSPTGPLHFGSLIAALGSYLQARSSAGTWLVRMEDLDPPREQKGAADNILHTLECFGFQWDEDVYYQSRRSELYEATLEQLMRKNQIFACQCTRKSIIKTAKKTSSGYVYPGFCRRLDLTIKEQRALRIKTYKEDTVTLSDRIQGCFSQHVHEEVGDFVLKRRDGLYAYQLAVVVDDHEQQISEVVRGNDLLNNTPRQIVLQQRLGYETPGYLHLPLALNQAGDKLSKQTLAPSLDLHSVIKTLFAAWQFLGQSVPDSSNSPDTLDDFYKFALEHWDITRIPTSQIGYKI